MTSPVTFTTLQAQKSVNQPFSMVTAYDFPFAQCADKAGIDVLLVGDSLGNVVLGYSNTLDVTLADMCHHVGAVSRAAKRAMVLADLPYLAHQHDANLARESALTLKKAGADAIKCEVTLDHSDYVSGLWALGIPIVAHLGFTPQSVEELGGYKVQGRDPESAAAILELALRMEQDGASAILIEMVPATLGAEISRRLQIPVIGIGAGPDCDGQVLVGHDILGFSGSFSPRFVKKFGQVDQAIEAAFTSFKDAVSSRNFPSQEHSF